LARNLNDKQIAKTLLTVPYPYTLRDAKQWIKKNLKELKKKQPDMLSFVIDIGGKVVGAVAFHKIETGHQAEIGYWLAKKYWGQGIMTEAVRKVTDFGFKGQGLKRIYAYVFALNQASMKVLKKAGYKLEGILRKHAKRGKKFLDDYLFAKTR